MTLSREQRSWLGFAFVLVVGAILGLTRSDAPPPAFAPVATSTAPVATIPAPANATSSPETVAWPAAVSSTALVVRVVDGDTVDALPDGADKVVRIRLLGINTPESVDPRRPVQCFGKEASHFMKAFVEGKRVALVEDLEADDHDKYGRSLRILVLEDGTDVNASLVASGYAHAYVGFPMKKERKAQLKRLETQAREGGRGLWNAATCAGNP